MSQSVAAVLPLDGLSSVTGLLVKSCRASQGWAKPFGDHRQAGAKLLMEQRVKSGKKGCWPLGMAVPATQGTPVLQLGFQGWKG